MKVSSSEKLYSIKLSPLKYGICDCLIKCEDVTNSKLDDKQLKEFDSLKKECPANIFPFCRDFWGDSNGGLPLSFY